SGQGRAHLRVREYAGKTLAAPAATSIDVPIGPEWKQVTLDYANAGAGSTLDFQALYDGADPRVQIDEVAIERAAGAAPVLNPPPANDDPSTWDEDELEDGGGAATLGQRQGPGLRFGARLYPSPLRDRSVLSFSTTRRGAAQVTLYDVNGRAVRALVRESDLGPGRHDVAIDGRDDRGERLRPGVYLYRVRAREGALSGRCV